MAWRISQFLHKYSHFVCQKLSSSLLYLLLAAASFQPSRLSATQLVQSVAAQLDVTLSKQVLQDRVSFQRCRLTHPPFESVCCAKSSASIVHTSTQQGQRRYLVSAPLFGGLEEPSGIHAASSSSSSLCRPPRSAQVSSYLRPSPSPPPRYPPPLPLAKDSARY